MKKIVFVVLIMSFSLFGLETNSKFDIGPVENNESREYMINWSDGAFELKPHKVNYVMPLSYVDARFKKEDPNAYQYKSIETEMQVSLKLNIGSNLLGLNERYFLAYTHRSLFQLYAHSSPFRETNYNPEGFAVFPVTGNKENLKSITLALAHMSNGRPENSNYKYISDDPDNLSRSVNYTYLNFAFQHDSLITDLKFWTALPENKKENNNPDIMSYYGDASLKFTYFLNKHMFTLMGRTSLTHGHGAVESTYSYPLRNGVFAYAKIFSGYGDSMIDYNNYVNRFSLGFAFSR
ncbi:phospholipase A [Sulfurimonas sp.]|uniref:phospholipase A n=1 Tax=Sulfurimonas sp. TaxID=2022749 RepID=UPI0025CC4A97|nr:phospholipase A [Sulfurimonas sp.]MDD5157218.1 phospholipase A [Sulfurimonas sp.]